MRPMFSSGLSLILFVAVLALGATTGPNTWADDEKRISETRKTFSEKDAKGPYGFSFDGFSIDRDSGATNPISAVGQLTGDGRGRVTGGVRTLNLGGQVLLQTIKGAYEVNPDGTGVARLEVSTLFDGAEIPFSVETFSFVINSPRNELQFVSTSITDPVGGDLDTLLVTRGVARRQ